MVQFFFDRIKNMVGKGENAGYQHFLLFPPCFLWGSFVGMLKVNKVQERVNSDLYSGILSSSNNSDF